MRLDEYVNSFKKLDTTKDMDERILNNVCQSKKPRKRIIPLAVKVAACILAFVFIAPTVYVSAENAILFFEKMFGEDVSEHSAENVYIDADDHAVMRVEELVSDGVTTRLIFSYELRDDEGLEWMDGYFVNEYQRYVDLSPKHLNDNTMEYGVNSVSPSLPEEEEQLKEYESSDKRYFIAECVADSFRYGTNQVEFRYLMPEGGLTSCTLEIEDYELQEVYQLVNEEAETVNGERGKLYLPTQIMISPFSVLIEGKDLGIGTLEEATWSDDERLKIDSMKLIFKDGEEWDLLWRHPSYLKHEVNQAYPYKEKQQTEEIDCSIFTGAFCDTLDISQIKGIRINSVYYEFKTVE